MKPGDLRRFKDGLKSSEKTQRVSGQPFVVLRVVASTAGYRVVDVLVNGKLEKGLGHNWVMDNSEAISEVR